MISKTAPIGCRNGWSDVAVNTQPTYKRQRFLLDFMRQLNGSVTQTELQKLVFLNTMGGESEHYEFLPYRYGAYSFQLAEDMDILRRDGYLSLENNRVKAIGKFPQASEFNIESERGNNLVRKAYRAYPYYTINSEILGRLFRAEELVCFESERNKYIHDECTLFTVGYEGKSIEAFANILLQNGVKLLCDVRKNPLSRKFGFSKRKLEHITGTVGIKYVHIPGLGIETDKRSSLETAEDYKRLFASYKMKLPQVASYLNQVVSLLDTHKRIALMCFELEASMCHRHVVRDYIVNTCGIRSADL